MVTVSSHVTMWNRCKIVTLLLSLFGVANCMIYLCLTYGVHLGYNIFAFMIAEVCTVMHLIHSVSNDRENFIILFVLVFINNIESSSHINQIRNRSV